MAGKRVIDDPHNALYREVVRVLREALPQTFMLENVKGLISMGQGAVIKQICEDISAAGYSVQWQLIDAADYGVPQHRERVIFIGERQDVITFNAEKEKVGLHMGALVGEARHPDWFKARYPVLFQGNLFEE